MNKCPTAFSRTDEINDIHTVFIHLIEFKALRNLAERAIVESVSLFRICNQPIQIDVGLYLTKLGFVKIKGVDFKNLHQKGRHILNTQLQHHWVCSSKLRLVGIAKINIDAFSQLFEFFRRQLVGPCLYIAQAVFNFGFSKQMP